MTPPKMPEPVSLVLNKYRRLVEQHAPELMVGLYLYGSVAQDAFSEGLSDIDFIAVLSRKARPEDIEVLERIHRDLAREHPQCPMEGSYLQWQDLGRAEDHIAAHPCYHDGRLHHSAHHDINPVTWWILKNHGVALVGPEPASLAFEVSWEEIVAYMKTNLNTYWATYASAPKRLGYLLTDDGVQWAVLGVCRLLYALQVGSIPSKLEAGRYALGQVPEKWHRLIKEAVNLRSGLTARCYRSRTGRALDTVAYLRYVIAFCNSRFGPSP